MKEMIKPIKILLTGADGQLGKSIQKRLPMDAGMELIATDVDQLDITNPAQIKLFFEQVKPDFCINAAAYTAVDAAESNPDLAFSINADATEYLAKACQSFRSVLIHISSDYVYHSWPKAFLTEKAPVNPRGIYAVSKLRGEKNILKQGTNHFIIRTSWLYSEFGNNFVHTMLNLAAKGVALKLIDDQIGSPSYASDLADAIFVIIRQSFSNNELKYGTYNFSNLGVCSWYDFAGEIFKYKKIELSIEPIPSEQYPTAAVRPLNSKLSKKKIRSQFGLDIPHWQTSLHNCLDLIK